VNDSITLGRIAGIRFGVNWSWLIVFALITWTLATGVFPDTNPGRSNAVYVTMAIAAALLFFSSLLAHELGHAVVARREGMEIEGITLWLFGGVAKFRGMFPSAGAEFRIAIAGPLVSLALGLGFAGAAWLVPLPSVVDGVGAWLGYINLSLLVFNLIPALPLDGGRVLRSALWQARGSFTWATHVAALIGRGFGVLFIAAGIGLAIWQSAYSGIWLSFIGWFLLQAAGQEDRHLRTRAALGGLRVRDLMVRDPVTARPDDTIGAFVDGLEGRRFTTYPVTANGHVVGLLPFSRVTEVPRAEWDARTVADCLVPLAEVPTLHAEAELVDAAAELSESGLNRGLVLEGGTLVGLLSMTDVVRALRLRSPGRPGPGRRRRPG
jgi:Zn-dependent protease/CBS domain-containing protein